MTGREPEFQPSHAGGDHSESLQPAGPNTRSSRPVDSDRQVSYGNEDVPLTSERRYGSELAGKQYAPPNPPETAVEGGTRQTQEQQPQVRLTLFTANYINILSKQLN